MAAGELGVWLSLRGRSEMISGLREVNSGVRAMTRSLKEVDVQAAVTDKELTKVYHPRHLAGLRSLNTGIGGLHTGLGRLVTPLTAVSRAVLPLIGLAGVGGIAVALHAGVREAEALQTAMGRLQTEAGVKAAQIPGLTIGARQVAAQTGIQASKLTDNVLFHLEGTFNKEGRPLGNRQALDMARVIGQGAQIGGAPVDDVAKAFSGLSVTKIRGADGTPEQLMGKLLAIVGAGGTMRMGDLASAVGSGLVPNLKALGLGLDDVGGALATMTDNAVPAETAVKTLNTSLMHVQKPTKQGMQALGLLGMTQLELATDLRKPNGLVTMVDDLKTHLGRLPGGAKGVLAQDFVAAIFGGSKGSGPIQLLIDQTQNLSANIDKVSHSSAATFTAAWDVASHTFAVQKARMVETARNAASGIGAALLPTLGHVTEGIAGFITDASTPVDRGRTPFDRANAGIDLTTPGKRARGAFIALRSGNDAQAVADLGITGTAGRVVKAALEDIRAIARDTGRIFHDSVLPTLKDAGMLFGGAVGIGLHLLRDTTGFLAAHSTTTKVLLDSMLAVMTLKTVGTGMQMLYALPGRLAAIPRTLLPGSLSGKAKLGEAAFVQKVFVTNPGFGAAGGAAAAEGKAGAAVASGAAGVGARAAAAATARGAATIGLGAGATALGGIYAADQLGQLLYGAPAAGKLAGRNLADYDATTAWLAANGSLVSAGDRSQLAQMAAAIASGVGMSTDAVLNKAQQFEAIVYPYQRNNPGGAPSRDTRRTRAAGGPVSAGQMYQVNEQGIEMFVPNLPGTVLSASATERAMTGSAGARVQVIVAKGAVQISGHGVTDEAALNRVADRAVDRLAAKVSDKAARL